MFLDKQSIEEKSKCYTLFHDFCFSVYFRLRCIIAVVTTHLCPNLTLWNVTWVKQRHKHLRFVVLVPLLFRSLHRGGFGWKNSFTPKAWTIIIVVIPITNIGIVVMDKSIRRDIPKKT